MVIFVIVSILLQESLTFFVTGRWEQRADRLKEKRSI
jgi:hypothetical protein